MDLGAFVKGESPWFGDRGFAGIARASSRKPLIAAIEGFAVAGGMEIALGVRSDRRGLAAPSLGSPRPSARSSLLAAPLLRLPRRMPYHMVMELALTGDTLPAERFHEFGVVNRIAEPGGVVDVALELAALCRQRTAPLALIASKRILQEQYDGRAEIGSKQM